MNCQNNQNAECFTGKNRNTQTLSLLQKVMVFEAMPLKHYQSMKRF